MFLFIILMAILVMLVLFTVSVVAVGGSVFIIAFGDVIVCIFLIAWIIKHLFHRKK